MRVSFPFLLIMSLVSCTAPQNNFAAMTEAELLIYNSGRPVLKQIFCQKMTLKKLHVLLKKAKSTFSSKIDLLWLF